MCPVRAFWCSACSLWLCVRLFPQTSQFPFHFPSQRSNSCSPLLPLCTMESPRRRCKRILTSPEKKGQKSLCLPCLLSHQENYLAEGLRGILYLASSLKQENGSVTRRTRARVQPRGNGRVTLLSALEGPSALAPTLMAWSCCMPHVFQGPPFT